MSLRLASIGSGFVSIGLAAATLAGCGGAAVNLHAPVVAENVARTMATKVEIEPITMRPRADEGTAISRKRIRFERPDPAAALTAGMRAELGGRALQGGDAGGYDVKCMLERFAIRTQTNVTSTRTYAVLYADLSCDVERATDHTLVWRGMLRGRAITVGGSTFGRDAGMMQSLADRLMSDGSRELASDLAVRALGLVAGASARVFTDEEARVTSGGIDDMPLGTAALAESAEKAAQALPMLHDADANVRASAWNVVAMAAGPSDAWPLGTTFTADDDLMVRFYQFKALARQGSPVTMAALHDAVAREDESVLADFGRDAAASGGLGLTRTNASADTKGTTIKP